MRRRIVVLFALSVFLPATLPAQQVRDTAAARIRQLVAAEDYEGAIAQGKALAGRPGASAEARAWTLIAMARYGMSDAALDGSRALLRQLPGSTWAQLAYGTALMRAYEPAAIKVVEDARKESQWNPLLVALHADIHCAALANGDGPAAALALLDSASTRARPHPALWLARATAELAPRKPDTAALRRAGAAADEALRLDSAEVRAWAVKVDIAGRLGATEQVLEGARGAVAAAPSSVRAHELLWTAITQRKDLTSEQARGLILADIGGLQKARGRTPGLLSRLVALFGKLGMAEQRTAILDELRRDHPRSFEVEVLDGDTIRALQGASRRNPPGADAVRAELRRRAAEFVAVPGRSRARMLTAYEVLLAGFAQDSTAPIGELEQAALGGMKYRSAPWVNGLMPALLRLAEHAQTRATAERIARQLPRFTMAGSRNQFIFIMGPTGRIGGPDAPPEERRQVERITRQGKRSEMHDVLGWAAFNAGRLAAARVQLDSARMLAPGSNLVLYHLGRLAERRGQMADALPLYARGVAGQENRAALERIFRAQDSTAGAVDRLVARQIAEERQAAKDTVLAHRAKNPRSLPSFVLTRLNGGTFSTEELKGKIAVVDFWGTWCKSCVDDLIRIQKVYERYRNDPDVVVTTVAVEEDSVNAARIVTKLMNERHFTFPVALGNAQIWQLIPEFPKTWYIDAQGRVAYEEGISFYGTHVDDMEPFVWRIDSLRKPAEGQAKAAPVR